MHVRKLPMTWCEVVGYLEYPGVLSIRYQI